MSSSLNIVIGSAGRRLYLLRWFREALDTLDIPGQIIVTESDRTSAAFTAGDDAVLMPRYSDPSYQEAMLRMVDHYRPSLFVSVNDWELAKLGDGLGDELRARGVVVPGIADANIAKVTDKLHLERFLNGAGIQTPQTVLASDSVGVAGLTDAYSRLIIKDRMGSGSSGLQIADSSELSAVLNRIALSEPSEYNNGTVLDQIVVQPFIRGDEYGLDVVGSFEKYKEREFHVLARRKLRMRAGETDKAETVDPGAFADIAADIGSLFEPTGLIDVDVLCDSNAGLHVIDINPRFGGGYPFVHLAGANVPLYYVSSLIGYVPENSWATYRNGVVSAKYEEIRVSSLSAPSQQI